MKKILKKSVENCGRIRLEPAVNFSENWIQSRFRRKTFEFCSKNGFETPCCLVNSPNNDNDEIQQIPRTPQIGTRVRHKSVGNDLHEALQREDDQEEVFNFLLEMFSKSNQGFPYTFL